MTLNADRLSHRLSWRGVFAGMVMGLVTTFTLIALGTVITALTGLTLSGVGIAAAIWSGIAALVGAYVAGLTAVRAAAPATRNDDGIAAMTHDDANLTGLVTAGMIILLSTLFAFNSASRLLGNATTAASNVLGAGATATAAAGTATAQNGGVQDFVSGINEQDIVDLIAGNSDELNEQQVQATSNVVTGIFRRAQYDLGQQDLSNITDFAGARVTAIKNALTGEQFVTRLQRQGLSEAQAQEVRTVVTGEVDRLEKQAQQVADATERTARTAASTAGWAWLLAAGLTLGASVMGARSAATSRATARRA
ncbi:hypothetical protein [Deinococcus soli (ex Cha et al. 2016)]|uniref:Uncharacterized protein n=2 Tax=Deinococcus soli (ex Cha et al. 2016) TaxID=1309411 RepID=A0AAE3XAU5_9DEIO|nr:hypothetical protein [Deinococcus soli (ex Cha et al. 2016)]MDR6218052.1 hypothetical protein [Deinococcus soli (ex Cha et al. 2016)]MDR6328302.1 hypothetical protein [Deinococcus soli (ex Cha et al. 2016)]MDR6751154.1 hypothetical protein [Deinococcus soli (ex Cha et al. 2016)]